LAALSKAGKRRGFAMRFTGNFFSEEAYVGGGSSDHTLLVPLIACAVGATASGAVLLYLVGSPITQPAASSIPPRAIVRNAVTSEPTETAKNQPIVEMPLRPPVTTEISGRDKPVTQTESGRQVEVYNQQARKQRSRQRYRQGQFAHAFWSSPRFSSRRDELTSGVR
jgi:hypothetical protein